MSQSVAQILKVNLCLQRHGRPCVSEQMRVDPPRNPGTLCYSLEPLPVPAGLNRSTRTITDNEGIAPILLIIYRRMVLLSKQMPLQQLSRFRCQRNQSDSVSALWRTKLKKRLGVAVLSVNIRHTLKCFPDV